MAVALLAASLACGEQPEEIVVPPHASRLWGTSGEAWDPAGRLPEFSWAGYRGGEDPPLLPVTADIRDFGAEPDDEADDTAAFQAALATADPGAIHVPAGRYLITDVLRFERSGLALRGDGPDTTILEFPRPLGEVGKGEYGGPYGWAWGGGWISAIGDLPRETPLATVVAAAARGSHSLQVSSTVGLEPGAPVRLVQRESDGSLTLHLHNQQPLYGRCWVDRPGEPVIDWVVEVAAIADDRVELARPLRADVRPEWRPELLPYSPTLTDIGVEELAIEFPNTEYPGHHLEPGLNGIFFRQVHDAWVRNVRIANFDNGITLWLARHVTVADVVLAGRPGHYGFNLLASQDSLVTGFDIRNASLHDLSVSNLANGNVFSRGRGIDINFDHHRGAPYENLFSDIDVGASWRTKRLWESSGIASGHYTAARETFWNIRPKILPRWIPAWPQLNIIGRVRPTDLTRTIPLDDFYLEAVEHLEPRDLHTAQRARRLAADR